jgi:hypothetical protein
MAAHLRPGFRCLVGMNNNARTGSGRRVRQARKSHTLPRETPKNKKIAVRKCTDLNKLREKNLLPNGSEVSAPYQFMTTRTPPALLLSIGTLLPPRQLRLRYDLKAMRQIPPLAPGALRPRANPQQPSGRQHRPGLHKRRPYP